MSRQQWRTRTRGSSRQVGKKFIIGSSQQKLKSQLPKLQGVRQRYPNKEIELSLKVVNVSSLVPTEKRGSDFESGVQHIIAMYKRGETLPPILVHRDERTGRLLIKDGHKRVEAYRRLGVTRVPAVENGLLESLSNATKWIREKGVAGTRKAWQVARKGVALGRQALRKGTELTEKAGMATARTIGRAEAFPEEIREAYREGKAERPWREKGEIAKHLERKPEPKVATHPLTTPPFSAPTVPQARKYIKKARLRKAVEPLMDIEEEPERIVRVKRGTKKARVVIDIE